MEAGVGVGRQECLLCKPLQYDSRLTAGVNSPGFKN